ncbi:MAG: DsbE family thiol:disulfide interchange protein [Alphaproteobacteria bacterium]
MTLPRLRFVLPLAVFAALALALAVGLTMSYRDVLPSPLIDKPAPAFDLPPVSGREHGLSDADLKGDVRLVNFFASWCIPCRVEHPVLKRLNEEDLVSVYGINYKDKPGDVRRWLDRLGDPYRRAGADLDGRVGIDWGVYGLPETFIVDREGRIRYKHVGPLRPENIDECILPVVEALRGPEIAELSVDLPSTCQRTNG